MSNDNSASTVSKVCYHAHVLKNAGVGYGDYVEVRSARVDNPPAVGSDLSSPGYRPALRVA